jgi:hypothetical protein
MLQEARRLLPLVMLAAALALPSAAHADPSAQAARSCKVGDVRGYGTTYVLGIRASGVSCRRARTLVRAFHACRPGKSGRCPRVSGYRCSERRFNKSSQSYDSRVSCRNGDRTVKHTYTQFL